MEIYGFNPRGYSTANTLSTWVKNSQHCGWMAVAKYKTAAYMAAIIENKLPKKPFEGKDDPLGLVGGEGFRWLQSFNATASEERRISFATSILFSKKGMPRPGKPEMDKEVVDTFRELTTLSKLDRLNATLQARNWSELTGKVQSLTTSAKSWADQEDTKQELPDFVKLPLITEGMITEAIKRTTEELLEGATLDRDDLYSAFFPSTSANYLNSRGKGGAVGFLLRHENLGRLFRTDEEDLVSVSLDKPEFKEEDSREATRPRYYANTSALDRRWEAVFSAALDEARRERPVAELVPLSEALKVRVISKGPPMTYFVMTPLQKMLHRVLKKNPVLRLIGMPITEQYLAEQMGTELKADQVFGSIDYKAATNKSLVTVNGVPGVWERKSSGHGSDLPCEIG